jgi:hypothetical protein
MLDFRSAEIGEDRIKSLSIDNVNLNGTTSTVVININVGLGDSTTSQKGQRPCLGFILHSKF